MTVTNGDAHNGNLPPAKKLHFIIVGGSLGGLSIGLALKDIGHDTTILERNPEKLLHNQGAGIVAGGDSLEFLKRYNRCDRPVAVSSQKRQYYDKDGQVVHERVMTQNMTSWDLTYFLMRANYDGVKSNYCDVPEPLPHHGKAVHLHGHKVTSFEAIPDGGVRVHYIDTRSGSNNAGTMDGDILIAADGPSSTIRSNLFPDSQRTFAGYCALRGTVPEHAVTSPTLLAFRERFAFFHAPGIQILAYLIPGINGTVEPGQRLINFVYYTLFPEGSKELDEILTDKDGVRHRITMPPGKTDPKAWEKQKAIARDRLPPQFAEIICATKAPFVQAITDVPPPPANSALDDRVVLIGDALAGFRPHTVASTSQACFDAMTYAEFIAGKISSEEWKRQTMGYARFTQDRGVKMGVRSQFGEEGEDGKWRALSLEELIRDRDEASVPRREQVWPEWTTRI
ncbi:hypothetical protein LTR70_009897 [Exophiala xenobiotica]|uniref:2,6-dihydroxypyridine 3-monooxygenase substrate binding domain-containing protein n=1 Tax=Lithohypha guttulata TaxID=1690604 RepID=A0ABR0JWF7_9EURO|nr:hypothetical protein LTR24_009749 [Lithohypha guttulata]KAK5309899.1 hypothetical protein LTR70_009897 [Exophiala xenobiotica]